MTRQIKMHLLTEASGFLDVPLELPLDSTGRQKQRQLRQTIAAETFSGAAAPDRVHTSALLSPRRFFLWATLPSYKQSAK